MEEIEVEIGTEIGVWRRSAGWRLKWPGQERLISQQAGWVSWTLKLAGVPAYPCHTAPVLRDAA